MKRPEVTKHMNGPMLDTKYLLLLVRILCFPKPFESLFDVKPSIFLSIVPSVP